MGSGRWEAEHGKRNTESKIWNAVYGKSRTEENIAAAIDFAAKKPRTHNPERIIRNAESRIQNQKLENEITSHK